MTETIASHLDMPVDQVYCPTWFHIVYYGLFMPFSYIGNFLTCVIVIKLMKYRHAIPDVLVGGLALNDVLTAVVVFTWSIIAEIRQKWIPWPRLCRFHAVAKAWYIYTTFAIIVLMSVERWLAIIKPFYHQVHISTLKMKLTIGGLGLFCLLGSSISLHVYPVDLKPGWYCAMTAPYRVINDTRVEIPGAYPYPYTVGVTVMLTIGIAVLLVCNIHIIIVLRKKSFKRLGVANLQLENRFAKIMGIIAVIFVATWVPSLENSHFTIPLCSCIIHGFSWVFFMYLVVKWFSHMGNRIEELLKCTTKNGRELSSGNYIKAN